MIAATIYIALAAVAFLTILNGFLMGSEKAKIDAVLGALVVGLILAAVIVSGWKSGLFAIGIAWLSAVVSRPIAARVASWLFSLGRKSW